jgi:hypothetical protein
MFEGFEHYRAGFSGIYPRPRNLSTVPHTFRSSDGAHSSSDGAHQFAAHASLTRSALSRIYRLQQALRSRAYRTMSRRFGCSIDTAAPDVLIAFQRSLALVSTHATAARIHGDAE